MENISRTSSGANGKTLPWFPAMAAVFLLVGLLFASPLRAGELEERVQNARVVLNQVMSIPDNGIPCDLFAKCKAVAVFPHVVKGAFILGGNFGRGIISVHNPDTGAWSPPALFTIAGGSLGFQAGIEAIDLVLLVMAQKGVDSLLKSKVKLGADIGVTAGPVGRRLEAGTDILLYSEIYSYSRSKGLFAGVSLEGATILEDQDANRALYGKEVSARDILLKGEIEPPAVAQGLINTLQRLSSPN